MINEQQLYAVERKYPELNTFEVNGVKIWPFFRTYVKFELLKLNGTNEVHRSFFVENTKIGLFTYVRAKVLLLRQYARLFLKFKKVKYIFLSNHLEKKKFRGATIDKLCSGIINTLGEKDCLFIENGNNLEQENFSHKKISMLNSRDVNLYMYLLPDVKLEFTKGSLVELNRILREIEVTEIELNHFQYFFKRVKIFKALFREYKPQLFFSACYTYTAEVFAANACNIQTVELQHGIISEQHTSYYSELKLDRGSIAKNIFTFGENSFSAKKGVVYDVDTIYPVGNYYLELLRSESIKKETKLSDFQFDVAVPLDYVVEDELLAFVLGISSKYKNICFHLIPRVSLKDSSILLIKGFDNIKIVKNLSYQDFVRRCDVNLSTDSTCCLEALNLGIPNILYNIDNKAFNMFDGKVDLRFTSFVNTSEEFYHELTKIKEMTPSEIIESQQANYKTGYVINVREAVKAVLSF